MISRRNGLSITKDGSEDYLIQLLNNTIREVDEEKWMR